MSQPKIIHGMTNAEYHSQSSISKSGLDLIAKAPAVFKHRRANPMLPTDAMRMGTLVHTAILEPHLLADLMVAPKIDRRSAAGKAEWEAFKIASEGKELVNADELELLERITAAVRENDAAAKSLDMLSEVETSIFWIDPETGIECRCRPDGILRNGVILDVKTTRGATPDSFAKSIAQYRYHVQAAFYGDGYEAAYGAPPTGFMFLAVETEAPHLTACYFASAAMIARGRADYKANLATYRECLDTDEWPGLNAAPTFIDLPKWA
jgi:hypothetical protein